MKASAAEASCSELSLYAFKPRFIQSEDRIFDHVTRTFPRQGTYAYINTSVYRLCINPFISLHFILGHFPASTVHLCEDLLVRINPFMNFRAIGDSRI